METAAISLVERVQGLVQRDEPAEWGSPLLSVTPTPLAIHALAKQLASAEQALLEIARDVQSLARRVEKLVNEFATAAPAA